MIAEDDIKGLNAWLAKAGLRGEPETALVNGFCERAVAAGLPISRALLLIDTLHPVYEGRVVRWGYDPSEPAVQEYGRAGAAAVCIEDNVFPKRCSFYAGVRRELTRTWPACSRREQRAGMRR